MDSSVIFYYDEDKHSKKHATALPFGTLIEYDEKGEIVWSWKCSSYFRNSDVGYRKRADAITNMDVHDNGFYFDEKDSLIYISYRNINTVLKVKYPGGKVLRSYGDRYKPDTAILNKLFCGQHSCRISKEGYLYLFNNNACHAGETPKLMMFQEPVTDKDSLKIIWQYNCTVDGVLGTRAKQYSFPTNGNITELPDKSFLATMSSEVYDKVFIVSHDKRVLWSALPEKWNTDEKKWQALHEYRASIINSRKELEELIWNLESK
jgi:hypothetical protein